MSKTGNYLYILKDLHKAWLEICWHDQVTPQLKSRYPSLRTSTDIIHIPEVGV